MLATVHSIDYARVKKRVEMALQPQRRLNPKCRVCNKPLHREQFKYCSDYCRAEIIKKVQNK